MSGGGPGFALRSWRDPAVVALALMAAAAGFGQFGAVAALGDVARHFGRVVQGNTITAQAGLSGTELGVGLAILRLASAGGLPLTSLADRVGRRPVLLISCTVGLVFTVAAALSPGYWWFVVIFALGRPQLSATNAVAQVCAAEETNAADRAKAIALIAAGYAVGGGIVAVIDGTGQSVLSFRGVFALAAVPLVMVVLIRRRLVEPARFTDEPPETRGVPVLGAIGPRYRRRLVLVSSLAFAVGVVTGPANSFIFVYARNVLHMSGDETSLMVVAAGVFGLAGLLLGRVLADKVGRRPTAAVAMAAMALTGILTYSGSRLALLGGYEMAVLSAATFAPAAGALANELFPTAVRASVAGWNVLASVGGAVVGLVVFGVVADVGNRFAFGATLTFLPVLLAIALFLLLPETHGREPEELWPGTTPDGGDG